MIADAMAFGDVLAALAGRANGARAFSSFSYGVDLHGNDVRGEAWANCPVCDGPRLKIEEIAGGAARVDCLDGCKRTDVIEALDLGTGSGTPAATSSSSHLLTGAEFILDAPTEIPAVWGAEEQVLWASGEPLYIVGPAGVGKTTLAQNLALRRHGIGGQSLLGFPLAIDPRPVLYIAADRPPQAQRSFARMVTERDRAGLDFLKVWRGALPFGDLGARPDAFAEWLHGLEVGTVVIDSLKDVALGLSEDTPGAAVNQALQRTLIAGIEVVALHHQRKASGDNKRPRTLADVYGSTWLTAGAGSVLLLWGQAGDPIVELRHLKQPAEDVGPLKLIHDAHVGGVALHEPTDLFTLVRNASSRGGLLVREAAIALFGTPSPEPGDVEKARRRLDGLARSGKVRKVGDGSSEPVRYVAVELRAMA